MSIKLKRTNSILAILSQAEIRLHVLKNTWPIGIRSIDSETDRKIEYLTEYIRDLKNKIEVKNESIKN